MRDDVVHPCFVAIVLAWHPACCWQYTAGHSAMILHGRPSAHVPDLDTITCARNRASVTFFAKWAQGGPLSALLVTYIFKWHHFLHPCLMVRNPMNLYRSAPHIAGVPRKKVIGTSFGVLRLPMAVGDRAVWPKIYICRH